MKRERHPRKSRINQLGRRTKNEDVMFIRGIPPELKHKFKAYCVLRGKSMTSAITRFMRDAVNKDPRLQDESFSHPTEE